MTSSLPITSGPPGDVLAAHGLGHQFQPNWWCLQGVELTLRRGELTGVVGPNGAGKSTLMNILNGQMRPTTGHVSLGGRPLTEYSRLELARRIAFLPQDVRSSFRYTVQEVIAQGRYPHLGPMGLLGPRDVEVVRRVMEWTHTSAFAKRPLEILSGGERQRVLLASVLAQEAGFVLLDEPTAALDLHHQVDVFDRLARLAAAGLGIIVITHDLNVAAQYCHRLVIVHEGRIAADGPPAQVMQQATLEKVYDARLIVEKNPVTGAPMVVVLGRGASQAQEEATPWDC